LFCSLPFSFGQPLTLIASNGLAWHRIVGQDYYSQHQEVVARKWYLMAPESHEWTAILHRASRGQTKGYLLTVGRTTCQSILPASDNDSAQECSRVKLTASEPTRLILQSISPGGELADKDLRLELFPSKSKP